jgi:phenylalanyl-tRNA synthetase alpha chain
MEELRLQGKQVYKSKVIRVSSSEQKQEQNQMAASSSSSSSSSSSLPPSSSNVDIHDVKLALLNEINERGTIEDTLLLCEKWGWAHDNKFVGAIKSLVAVEALEANMEKRFEWVLNDQSRAVLSRGSAEMQLMQIVAKHADGVAKSQLESELGAAVVREAWSACMKNRWLAIVDKKLGVVRCADSVDVGALVDNVREQLARVESDLGRREALSAGEKQALKRRKLIGEREYNVYALSRGAQFTLDLPRPIGELTAELVESGEWRSRPMKDYNLVALGVTPDGGHLHPLLKVRTQYRQIFLEMGFEEMPTAQYVENGFWNFDALFQPQQHPARDAHDTFFIGEPAETTELPAEYLARVKEMHERGGSGSIGWRYQWAIGDAQANILRTHTTAVSARQLYALGQRFVADGQFTPKKLFSIDKVYRNESIDATHLAEFHQIEGLVADRNLTLGHLIGVIRQFFAKLGMTRLRFKPAYNPYTEPSMEVFGFHDGLGKWVELGNSGMFRPEMLRPMGLPEDVSVIAWGLSLERPTMIKYAVQDIRTLVGNRLSLPFVRQFPLVL